MVRVCLITFIALALSGCGTHRYERALERLPAGDVSGVELDVNTPWGGLYGTIGSSEVNGKSLTLTDVDVAITVVGWQQRLKIAKYQRELSDEEIDTLADGGLVPAVRMRDGSAR